MKYYVRHWYNGYIGNEVEANSPEEADEKACEMYSTRDIFQLIDDLDYDFSEVYDENGKAVM